MLLSEWKMMKVNTKRCHGATVEKFTGSEYESVKWSTACTTVENAAGKERLAIIQKRDTLH